ncbi:MAG: type IV pilin protein [Gammaproteobacteria bacterium]|nr:type IV pilin protein [Gammaproteobacteria bacterium]MDJ0871902.1 type IV pilin protein [Gammaproteobacteria bacterium]MDJ0891164.1 type IV pilin protein [Gammaproteobacteria bacterium]
MVRTERSGPSRSFTARQRGFTLIEVVLVVGIIGLLTAIVVPMYGDHMTKVRRADGKRLLMDISSRMERYYFDNTSYTTNLQMLGFAQTTNVPSEDGYYTAAVDGTTAGCPITSCYKVTASPKGAQSDDTYCGNFSLDSKGQKTVSTANPVGRCW